MYQSDTAQAGKMYDVKNAGKRYIVTERETGQYPDHLYLEFVSMSEKRQGVTQTHYVAFRRLTECRVDVARRRAFLKFNDCSHTFINDIVNTGEVLYALRNAKIPEASEQDVVLACTPRRQRKAFQRESETVQSKTTTKGGKVYDRESFEAGKEEGKLEMLLQIQDYKRRENGINPQHRFV